MFALSRSMAASTSVRHVMRSRATQALMLNTARTAAAACCARFGTFRCFGSGVGVAQGPQRVPRAVATRPPVNVNSNMLPRIRTNVVVRAIPALGAHAQLVAFRSSPRRTMCTSAGADAGAVIEGVGTDDTDPDGLIPILIRIQEIVKYDLEFPRFIVLGNQSSGKTSALEALIGMDILPKGQDMITRRPLEVTMVRTGSGQWVEFEDREQYFDFEEVKNRIREENLSINGVTNEPLRIKVFAPHFHNLTLVDLPGYISAVKPPMPRTVPKQIQDMVQPYIDDERNIMLVVCSATEDLANSMGLAKAQQADKSGRRSMGVVTKCDLVKYKHTLVETLQNRNFPLGLGYIGVRCRTQTELEQGMGFDELIEKEGDFFERNDFSTSPGVRTGLPLLRKELSVTLLRKVADELPMILRKLDTAIDEVRKNESFLDTLSKEPNLKTVSKELESLVTQLHPAADSRRSFEEKLRADLHSLLAEMWSEATEASFDFHGSQLVTESEYQPGNVRPEARALLKAMNVESASDLGHMEQLPSMIIHGQSPLKDTSAGALHKYKRRSMAQGAISAYYRPAFPTETQSEHRRWNRELIDAVDHIIAEQEGVEKCFQLLLNSLRDFADQAETSKGPASKAHLARLFFRYLLERIANRIQEEGLEETVVGMLDREKRPYAEYPQVMSKLAAKRNHPKDFSWFFGDSNPQLRVPVYGRDWTEAYVDVVAARTADDIFRILSVRMLEPLIFECISYSLNMFRADKIVKEADKQTAYLQELERYRDVIAAAAERYHAGVHVDL